MPRGGKRTGSGRPKEIKGDSVLHVRVSDKQRKNLARWAKARGLREGEAVRLLIETTGGAKP